MPKIYESWLAVDSYCNNNQAYFFGAPCTVVHVKERDFRCSLVMLPLCAIATVSRLEKQHINRVAITCFLVFIV